MAGVCPRADGPSVAEQRAYDGLVGVGLERRAVQAALEPVGEVGDCGGELVGNGGQFCLDGVGAQQRVGFGSAGRRLNSSTATRK